MIYFDNSATTEIAPEVRAAMQPYLSSYYGNASSIYSIGRRSKTALEESRSSIAASIGADPSEILFTSGGTEANNHAIKGSIFESLKKGSTFDQLSILTSQVEHHAVLEPITFMETLGVHTMRLSVSSIGYVDVTTIQRAEVSNVALASFMLVNNEVGTINNLRKIADMVHSRFQGSLIHSDAVQALGKINVDVKELGVDLMTISAHKIHGPKGIGALFIRRGVKIEPLLHGGSQERNRRGGTESIALAVGFGEAIRQMELKKDETRMHLKTLRQYAMAKLLCFPEVVLNSSNDKHCVDGIVNFSFVPEVRKRIDGEALLIRFDLAGIAVSNGSACTSGSIQPSHVLLAMGKGDEIASKSLRISFSRNSTVQEIDQFVDVLSSIIR